MSEPPLLIKNNDGSLSCSFKAKYQPVVSTYGSPGFKLEVYLKSNSCKFEYFCIDDSNPSNPSASTSYDTVIENIEGEHVIFTTSDDNYDNELVGSVVLILPNECGTRRLQIANITYHNLTLVLKENKTHVAVPQHVEYVEFQDVEVT